VTADEEDLAIRKERRKKAIWVLQTRADVLEGSARMANGPGNLLGEDADVVSMAFAEAARVIRGAIETIEAREKKE